MTDAYDGMRFKLRENFGVVDMVFTLHKRPDDWQVSWAQVGSDTRDFVNYSVTTVATSLADGSWVPIDSEEKAMTIPTVGQRIRSTDEAVNRNYVRGDDYTGTVVELGSSDMRMLVRFPDQNDGEHGASSLGDNTWWIHTDKWEPIEETVPIDPQLQKLRERLASGTPISQTEAEQAQSLFSEMMAERDRLSDELKSMTTKRNTLINSLCEIAADPSDMPSLPNYERWCTEFDAWMIRHGGCTANEIETFREEADQSATTTVLVQMSCRVDVLRNDVNNYSAVWEAIETQGHNNYGLVDDVTEDN